MGVRLRTTLTATAVVAVALGVVSVALFAALHASLERSARDLAVQDAKQRAALMAAGVAGATGGAPDGALPGLRQAPGPAGPGGVSADPGDPGGSVAPGSPVGVSGSVGGPPPGGTDAAVGYEVDKAPGLIVVSKVVTTKNGPVTVKGSASTAPAQAAMDTLTAVLIPGVPALLALVALLTWLAVGRTLRPVSAIRAKVADITAHGLHERVPVPSTRDEIAQLARTVNGTLDRLRTAVDAHRQFVADAAHELRSPLAILRARLELAAPAERRLAAEALDDVDRLGSLTSDLLLLARLDARQPLRAAEVDLGQVVAEEAARRRPRAEIAVLLDVEPDVLVSGSAEHLRRMVANLVDNAVRHAAATVRVALACTGPPGSGPRAAVLDVSDDGPGVPAAHHATVFQRFTRLDHARTRDTGGSGLGLPIARDIAAAHGGTLALVPGPGGARFRVRLPLPAVDRPAGAPVAASPYARRGAYRDGYRRAERLAATEPTTPTTVATTAPCHSPVQIVPKKP
jgi:signal transduction histidine kinase